MDKFSKKTQERDKLRRKFENIEDFLLEKIDFRYFLKIRI